GDFISQEDIEAGNLTFVQNPLATGPDADASFKFRVQDDGGTDHGGENRSDQHEFTLNVDQLIGNENPSKHNDDNTLNGGSGDDIMMNDGRGSESVFVPKQNYDEASIIDRSGSRQEPSVTRGKNRMELL